MTGNKGFIAGAGMTNADILYTGVSRLPAPGEEIYSEGFSLQLGGGLPATLIHLARLGIPAKIATALGEDLFSEFAKKEYEKSGVIPLNLYKGDGIPLNITSAMILPHDRSFITYGQGALTPTEADCEAFYRMARGAKIVLMQAGGFLDVYRQLKKEGATLVFDTGWDDTMSLATYAPLLELADYYTPNQKEAMKLTDTATPQEAARVLSRYFEKVIVKLDKDGCYGLDENGRGFTVPQVDRFTAVDSTGAGDAFLAGFCYGLYHERSFEDCIRCGNITGGKAVTKAGALSASCTEAELLQYLKEEFNV